MAEGAAITESSLDFLTASSTPKTVGAFCKVSRQVLLQSSPVAQNFLLRALAEAVAAELSRKLLVGSGADGQPLGIFSYLAVGTVSGGSANYQAVLDLIEEVETDSAIVNSASAGFVMTPDVARLLRSRETASGSGMVMTANDVSGYRAIVMAGSSPNTLTFGDWSQLALLEYSILEVAADPYGIASENFRSGTVGLRVLWTIDSILLHPQSFAITGGLN